MNTGTLARYVVVNSMTITPCAVSIRTAASGNMIDASRAVVSCQSVNTALSPSRA